MENLIKTTKINNNNNNNKISSIQILLTKDTQSTVNRNFSQQLYANYRARSHCQELQLVGMGDSEISSSGEGENIKKSG